MPKLKILKEGDLWDEYKAAIESWGTDPNDPDKAKRLNTVENEIVRRMREARDGSHLCRQTG